MMSEACPVYIGNSDAYGLGIRLGIYLQWTTSVINKWIFTDQEHLRNVLNENAIFIFSIFIATIVLAAKGEPKPHAIDIIILEHIFFGSIYAVFFDGHIIDNLEQISSFWGILFKWAMPVGMSALSVWFWARGLYELEPTCGGTTSFLFAPVDAFGNARKAFLAFACINMLIWTIALHSAIMDRLLHVTAARVTTQQDRAERRLSDSPEKNKLLTRIWEEMCVPMKEATINDLPGLNGFRDGVRQLLLAIPPTADDRLFVQSAGVLAVYRAILTTDRQTVTNRALSRYLKALDKALEFLENVRLPIVPSPEQQQVILQLQRDLLVGETDITSSRWGKHFGIMPGRRILARIISVLVPVPPSAENFVKDLADDRWRIIYAKYATKALNTFVLIYSILAIELLIRFNSITGVYDLGSTGQTIPLVIGLATLWRTVVAIFEKYAFPKKEVAVAEVFIQHAVASVAVQDGREMQDLEMGSGSDDIGQQRPTSPVASIH